MPWAAQTCTASLVSDDATTASAPVLAAAAGARSSRSPEPRASRPNKALRARSYRARDTPAVARHGERRVAEAGQVLDRRRQIRAHRDELWTEGGPRGQVVDVHAAVGRARDEVLVAVDC